MKENWQKIRAEKIIGIKIGIISKGLVLMQV